MNQMTQTFSIILDKPYMSWAYRNLFTQNQNKHLHNFLNIFTFTFSNGCFKIIITLHSPQTSKNILFIMHSNKIKVNLIVFIHKTLLVFILEIAKSPNVCLSIYATIGRSSGKILARKANICGVFVCISTNK